MAFLVFTLNVVAIYSTPKYVNVSCDDNVVKLSYIIIVTSHPFKFIIECVVVLMFKDVFFCICIEMHFIEPQYIRCFEIVIHIIYVQR